MPASRDINALILVMLQEYEDIAEYLISADSLNTRARTRYYKAAYYTSAQIVELLIYMIVLQACDRQPELLESFKTRAEVNVHDLSASRLGSTKKLHITETLDRASTINEVVKNLATMIAFCNSQKLVGTNLGKKLDRIRIKRNDIHLHLRTSQARTYTKAHIDQLADTTHQLIAIFLSMHHPSAP